MTSPVIHLTCNSKSFLVHLWDNTSSKGNLETLPTLHPPIQTLTFSGYSQGCSRDEVAPTATDIKGHIVRVICNIKGQGWSGLMGNARRWPWSWTSIV